MHGPMDNLRKGFYYFTRILRLKMNFPVVWRFAHDLNEKRHVLLNDRKFRDEDTFVKKDY